MLSAQKRQRVETAKTMLHFRPSASWGSDGLYQLPAAARCRGDSRAAVLLRNFSRMTEALTKTAAISTATVDILSMIFVA
ncbi:MAG TPA: hypothetical protein VKX45_14500 [Bryobacteraceae bacterium]|jgi:hypothetical protein|nr:hypothetical protein [Bryobacteraceae bacterium]